MLQKDGYKADHRRQYAPGITRVYTNQTPRTTKYLPKIDGTDNKVVVLGHTYFIKHYLLGELNRTFFKVPKEKAVGRYKRVMDAYLGKGSIDTAHIEALHDLGYMPITIRAIDEGNVIPAGVASLTIENTLPDFFWVTNFLETIASCMTWMMSNNATIARKFRVLMQKYARETGADDNFVQFQGHDFSFRGMSSPQSAEMSGFAHLTSFVGTDTIPALSFAEDYYGANLDAELVGCSVAATEHSVMCSYGKDGEIATFKHLLTKVYPSGILSVVSDTWDYWAVITEFLPQLKDVILARTGGPVGDKLVLRPDSGDPYRIVCGYFRHEVDFANGKIIVKDTSEAITQAEYNGSIECLWQIFGGKVNKAGYKELDPHIGLIYGDSINLTRCNDILSGLKKKGFASTNVVFGIGSYTYQMQTRDCCGYAFKATDITVNGEDRPIFKDPKTGDGMKKSARGKLVVLKNAAGEYVMVDGVTAEVAATGELKEVYRDGVLLRESTLAEIRERIKNSL